MSNHIKIACNECWDTDPQCDCNRREPVDSTEMVCGGEYGRRVDATTMGQSTTYVITERPLSSEIWINPDEPGTRKQKSGKQIRKDRKRKAVAKRSRRRNRAKT